jgi:predicted ArsR family transcriptional regulator
MTAGRAITRDEAAASVGISRKLAAFHLDKLVDAGLLRARYETPGGIRKVGRQPKVYEPTDAQITVNIPDRRHELLADLLLDAVLTEGADENAAQAAVRAAGQRGREVGETAREETRPGRLGPERGLTACEKLLDEYGYEPVREPPTQLRLRNCPFHPLAAKAPDLVCGMNQAFLSGYLGGLEITGVQAGCWKLWSSVCGVTKLPVGATAGQHEATSHPVHRSWEHRPGHLRRRLRRPRLRRPAGCPALRLARRGRDGPPGPVRTRSARRTRLPPRRAPGRTRRPGRCHLPHRRPDRGAARPLARHRLPAKQAAALDRMTGGGPLVLGLGIGGRDDDIRSRASTSAPEADASTSRWRRCPERIPCAEILRESPSQTGDRTYVLVNSARRRERSCRSSATWHQPRGTPRARRTQPPRTGGRPTTAKTTVVLPAPARTSDAGFPRRPVGMISSSSGDGVR